MYVRIEFVHDIQDGDVQCEVLLDDLSIETEPGEMYGTDADGNRGVWREGYLYCDNVPDQCPVCRNFFTEKDMERIDEAACDEARS